MARLTQTQWCALIDEQAQSGQSAVAFCAARGVDSKYFSLRKNQLAKMSDENRFVAITTKPLDNQSIQLHVGVTQLRIPAAVSPQWLADLVKALA